MDDASSNQDRNVNWAFKFQRYDGRLLSQIRLNERPLVQMTARRAGFSKLNSMVWHWKANANAKLKQKKKGKAKAKAKEAIFISSQSRFFRAHSHQLQSEGSRNMSKKKVLHQFSLHVAFLSIVTVSLGAHVLPGKPITIPPYLSPPCNAAYPENCPKPVYPNSTRPCNEANRCRIRPLFLLDGSGTQFLAWLFVEGSPLNLINAVLANATTVAFDRWLVDNKKDNSSQQLASTSAMKNGSSVKKGASFSLSRIDTTSAGLRDEELILNFSTTVKDLGVADMKDIVYRIPVIFGKLWVEGQKKGGANGGHKEGSSPP